MRAIVYEKYGSPDVLKMAEVQMPHPKLDEVLINICAVSINSWDWDMLTGHPIEYRISSGLVRPRNSLLHGCDIAGRVVEVGDKVTQFKIGDEVFGDLAEGGWGAFADYVCARESELFLKPANLSFTQAACLPHGGNLATQGLIDYGKLKKDQKVLINGGGGSTGTLAIQIAKNFDVELTAIDKPEKLDLMRTLGADHVIDYTEVDFTEQASKYDLIFDVKTTRSPFAYKRVLNPNGSYVTVGGMSSRILQMVCLKRFMGGKKFNMVVYKANKDLQYLLKLVDNEVLDPVVDRCYSLEDTADAFSYFGKGKVKGKVVVLTGNG